MSSLKGRHPLKKIAAVLFMFSLLAGPCRAEESSLTDPQTSSSSQAAFFSPHDPFVPHNPWVSHDPLVSHDPWVSHDPLVPYDPFSKGPDLVSQHSSADSQAPLGGREEEKWAKDDYGNRTLKKNLDTDKDKDGVPARSDRDDADPNRTYE